MEDFDIQVNVSSTESCECDSGILSNSVSMEWNEKYFLTLWYPYLELSLGIKYYEVLNTRNTCGKNKSFNPVTLLSYGFNGRVAQKPTISNSFASQQIIKCNVRNIDKNDIFPSEI